MQTSRINFQGVCIKSYPECTISVHGNSLQICQRYPVSMCSVDQGINAKQFISISRRFDKTEYDVSM